MERKRIGEIDCLRFLFAATILIHHFNAVFPANLLGNGYIGVEFFFLISGFLMAQHVGRITRSSMTSTQIANSTWTYIIRKIGSFYPYYFLALMLRLILFYVIIDYQGLREIASVLLQSIPTFTLTVFGLNFGCPFLYDSTFWYLSVMIISMFILYPMILKDRDTACKLLLPIISLFLLGYLYKTYGFVSPFADWTGFCYVGILRGIAQIALGASLSVLSDWLIHNQPRYLYSRSVFVRICLTLVKLGCYGIVFLFAQGLPIENIHVLLFLSIGILLSFSGIGYTIPDHRITRYLGKISLPIYIFHGLMRDAASKTLTSVMPSTSLVLVLSGASLILCVILMYLTDTAWKRLSSLMRKI